MNAVRANHRIGDRDRPIGEGQPDAVAGLIQSDQSMAQPDVFVGHRTCERGVQIAAMSQQIGRSEHALGAFAENHVELDFAGSPVPVVPGARIEGLRAQSLLEPKLAQNLHGVAADLNAGANPGELRRLLVHHDVEAQAPERGSSRKPAHAGADDRN